MDDSCVAQQAQNARELLSPHHSLQPRSRRAPRAPRWLTVCTPKHPPPLLTKPCWGRSPEPHPKGSASWGLCAAAASPHCWCSWPVTGWCPHQFASSSDRREQQEPFPPFLPLFLPKNSYNPLIAAGSSGSSTFRAVVPHLHRSYAQGCWSETSQGPILEGRDTSERSRGGSRCYAHCSAFGGDACSVRSKTAEDLGRHLLLLQPRQKGLQEPAAGGAAKALGSVPVVSQSHVHWDRGLAVGKLSAIGKQR